MNKDALKDFIQLAQSEIDNGSVEDKLRHILSAHLPAIFLKIRGGFRNMY